VTTPTVEKVLGAIKAEPTLRPGRKCFWCDGGWKEVVRRAVNQAVKRKPPLSTAGVHRALRKAGADRGFTSFRHHLMEHDSDLWEKLGGT
jgi:hypothetical protein